ncbi:MAG: hypothetical protein ACRC5T_02510 [Cetobacterium sp.]
MNIDKTVPEGMLRAVWNHDLNIWEETATSEEITEETFKKNIKFYNEELEFASKVATELTFGLIETSVQDEVKIYMECINPYKDTTLYPEIKRPSIFDKYK